jgi:hypothetical protein
MGKLSRRKRLKVSAITAHAGPIGNLSARRGSRYLIPLFAFVFILVSGYWICLSPCLGAATARGGAALEGSNRLARIQKLEIPFIPNQGQVDSRVKFYAHTPGGTIFVTENGEVIYSLSRIEKESGPQGRLKQARRGWVLKEELIGARMKEVKAGEKAMTKVSHFIGDNPAEWRADIPTYGFVDLGEAYEGIEVKLRAYGNRVEKLFFVKEGADPNRIRLRLSGSESLRVNEKGELEVKTGLGEVTFSRPSAYQEIDGRRVEVAVRYDLSDSEATFGFKLGKYERTRELVIDPLLQSTYLGGSSSDSAYSIAIDSEDNVYVAGSTTSSDFPGAVGSIQPTLGGGEDGFVSKFNSTMTSILQSTYLGGSGEDSIASVAIDFSGNVYVAGSTTSSNFPGTAGGALPSYHQAGDAFVAKLDSALTLLIQSTYLGGSGGDGATSIALDGAGNVFVAGSTNSVDFPGTNVSGTKGGAQPSLKGGEDGFVSKLNPALTSLIQSTYLGGTEDDVATSMAIDILGNVYVAGYTHSVNFPWTETFECLP